MNASAGAKAMADGDNTKNQNHMKKLLLMVAVVLVVGLGAAWAVHRDYYKHSAPPPGWAIVCDGQGHFGARFPDWTMWDGSKCHATVIEDDYNDRLMTSRQQAIYRAWIQYESDLKAIPEPPKHGVWQDCDR